MKIINTILNSNLLLGDKIVAINRINYLNTNKRWREHCMFSGDYSNLLRCFNIYNTPFSSDYWTSIARLIAPDSRSLVIGERKLVYDTLISNTSFCFDAKYVPLFNRNYYSSLNIKGSEKIRISLSDIKDINTIVKLNYKQFEVVFLLNIVYEILRVKKHEDSV